MSHKDKLLGAILSFLAAFFLFILLFVCVSKTTLMNKGYLLSVLDKTEYYTGVRNELVLDLKKSAGAAGFQPSVYDDFLRVEDIEKDAKAYINDSFTQKNVKVDEEGFKQKLNTHLQQVIKKEHIAMDKADEKRLASYVQINANGYKKYVRFPFIQYIVMGIQMMDRVLPFAIAACAVMLLVAIFFLWRMKLKQQGFALFTSAILSGAGWMCALLPAVILFGGFTHRIRLAPKYYYNFFTNYLDGYLWMLILTGVFFLLAGIIVLLFVYKKRLKLSVSNRE